MLDFLKKLFKPRYDADERRRHETPADDSARMLEMDEPMAGAGAEVSGIHHDSETEAALKRASGDRTRT